MIGKDIDECAVAYKAGRRKGLEDAWGAAKKIVCSPDDGGYTTDVLGDLFNEVLPDDILRDFTAEEAVEKIAEHERQINNYNNITVGSEVTISLQYANEGLSGVAIKVNEDGLIIFSPSDLTTYRIYRSDIKGVSLSGKIFGDICEIMNRSDNTWLTPWNI